MALATDAALVPQAAPAAAAPAVAPARGSKARAACWAVVAVVALGGALGAQLAQTGRSRLVGAAFGLVCGLPALWKLAWQCWWLYLDQRDEAERLLALVEQMQALGLTGPVGFPTVPGDAGDEAPPADGGFDVTAPPPGIPMMPGVTMPGGFPGGVAGPLAGGPSGLPWGGGAPLAAQQAPAGAASLGDLGAWAGAAAAGGGTAPQAVGPPPTAPEYRPSAQGAVVQAQAKQVKELLVAFSGAKASDFHWARRFWASIATIEAQGQLQVDVKKVLVGFGYVGPGTATAPRETELCAALERLGSQAALSIGGGPWAGGAVQDMAASRGGAAETRWGSSLPADLQRAGPEIYRAIRGEGSTSVRDWIAQRYLGSRSSPVWIDLWTLATSIDFRLRDCGTDIEIMQVLAVDDMMEIALRRLAAYVYEQRSGDRVGAQHMLGITPPGGSADVAPTWMVSSATTHSKTEHQRRERVEAELRNRSKREKGGGRGGDGGRGAGGRGQGGRGGGRGGGATTSPA